MNVTNTLVAAVFVCLFSLVGSAHAVRIGHYPGLASLVAKADAIAVIRIDKHLGARNRPDLSVRKSCFIHQSLKGNLRRGAMITVRLIDTRTRFESPFTHRSVHLVFLRKTKDKQTPYQSVYYKGSHIRLSPFGQEKRPKGKTLDARLRTLFRRAAVYAQKQAKAQRAFIRKVLSVGKRPVLHKKPRPVKRAKSAFVPMKPDKRKRAIKLFVAQCSVCHGRTGAGDGIVTKVYPKAHRPRSFVARKMKFGTTLKDIRRTIERGIPPYMTSFAGFSVKRKELLAKLVYQIYQTGKLLPKK